MNERLRRTNRTTIAIAVPVLAALDQLAAALVEEHVISPAIAQGGKLLLALILLAAIPDDLYRRIGRRLSGRGDLPPPTSPLIVLLLALGLALALPRSALATDARMVIECSKTTTIAVGTELEETCLEGDETAWLDFVVGAHVVALQLTGARKVLELGAAPSLGLILAFRPVWWTATKVLLGAEMLVSATVLRLDQALTHLEVWTVAAINLFGYLSIGIGGRYGISTTDGAEDFADLVLTSGFRVPI